MHDHENTSLTWRPMSLEDAPRIAEWFWDVSDAGLFDRSLPVQQNNQLLREHWRVSLEQSASPDAFWFIAETRDETPVGICGLDKINYIQGDAVLPFFVAKDFRNRGLAKAMAIFVTDLAFNRLRLHRLTTYYRSDNVGSDKILKRLGFTTEGSIREGWFANGTRKDITVAGILGSEWAAQRDGVVAAVSESCALSFTPSCWKAKSDKRL